MPAILAGQAGRDGGRSIDFALLGRTRVLDDQSIALDRVPQRMIEQARVHLSFDQVVLRADRHRLDGLGLVVASGHDHDRDVGGAGPDPRQHLAAVGVGQGEVGEYDVEALERAGSK